MKKGILAAVAACSAWSAGVAGAIDGVALELGSGDGVDMARIAVQSDWQKRWFQGSNWHLGGYWDLGLGQWHR
ncbi:MAG TPA: acyloxyacyl hydrolase, partial [Burkholderiales bacterium]